MPKLSMAHGFTKGVSIIIEYLTTVGNKTVVDCINHRH